MKKRKSSIPTFNTSKEMDDYLESQDLSQFFASRGVVERPKIKKINLDIPEPMLTQVDLVAARLGVSRQPLLKMWIHQMLEREMAIA